MSKVKTKQPAVTTATIQQALAEWVRLENQITPLRDQLKTIEADIKRGIKTLGTDADGNPVALTIEIETALAQLSPVTDRSVNPRDFLNHVAERDRSNTFWDCLGVNVNRAEKFLGHAFQTIATTSLSSKVAIKSKQ